MANVKYITINFEGILVHFTDINVVKQRNNFAISPFRNQTKAVFLFKHFPQRRD